MGSGPSTTREKRGFISEQTVRYLQKPSAAVMRDCGAVLPLTGPEAVLIDTGVVIFAGAALQVGCALLSAYISS